MIITIHSGEIVPVAALSGCFGILLVGVFVFTYLFIRSRRELHLATLMIVVPGLFSVGIEAVQLILGAMNETMAALQLHRVQALIYSLYLFAIPFFFGHFLDISKRWKKTNRIISYMGIGVFLIVAVAAVVTPDLFISVTKPFVHPFRSGISTGGGQHGILYNAVDALLLVLMVYSVCCIIVDYMKRGRDIYLMYVLAGVTLGMSVAIGDILYSHGVINWHGRGYVNYSFSGFGFTIFLTLSMAEVLRQFLDQSRELERARKLESLGIFAGGIAHDFNNFLTSIMGSISIVKKGTPRGDHKYQLLDDAERASRRARDLIQQLLTFSRGGAPVKTVVPVGDILHETVDFVLGGSDVRCEYSLPPDLWDIDADRGQIGQVIYNIVLNARQAMPRGGRITIAAENIIRNDGPEKDDNRRFVRVCVKDNGVGISSRRLKDIFVPYYTTKKDGSGLGLPITRSIIIKHGGEISVSSRKGEGTSVEFFIPASPEMTVKERVVTAEAGGRVLFMDDDAIICEVSSEMLRLLGYDVVCASSGEEAVDLYKVAYGQGVPFDCVIMDLTVPGGMNGIEAVRVLREFDPQCKAIVSSGYSDDPVMANYREYGFAGVCPKPYSVDALEAVLADVMKA